MHRSRVIIGGIAVSLVFAAYMAFPDRAKEFSEFVKWVALGVIGSYTWKPHGKKEG